MNSQPFGRFHQVLPEPFPLLFIYYPSEYLKALVGAEVPEEGEECAALTVHSPDEIITTPGCISSFHDQLSRKHINLEDTLSCYTDTIMVVSMKDAGKAFEALTELIEEEKGKLDG